MLNNRVCLGKYNLSMHSLATPDPVRPCTTDCTGIPKPTQLLQNYTHGCPHARMESTAAHRVPLEPIQGLWEPILGSYACVLYGTWLATCTIPYDCLRAFYGHKILGSLCRKVVQAQLSVMDWVKKSCGLTWHVVGLPTGSLVFDMYGAHELLRSFMWRRRLGDFVLTSNGP